MVFQPLTERNYHIFYQLCAGAPLKERKDLVLDTDVSKFHYLKQGGPQSTPINGVDDAEEFRTTQTALSTIGIGIEKQWAVFKLLAALLHLGNIKIIQMRNDSNIDDTDPALQTSTLFLGVPLADFKKWTVKKQITTRSEKIVTSLNSAQALAVRDSVAKFVYACLFEWLVAIVNESLAGENGEAAERAEMFIGVLDIYGFEHFKKVPVVSDRSTSRALLTITTSRTRSSSSVSTTPMRSSNKRYEVLQPEFITPLNRLSRSSTRTCLSWNRRNTFGRRLTGLSLTSRTTNLALTSSRAGWVFWHC